MLDSLICKKKVILTWHPIPFSLFHVYPFFLFCVWSRRKRTVRRGERAARRGHGSRRFPAVSHSVWGPPAQDVGGETPWQGQSGLSVSLSSSLSLMLLFFFNHLSLSPLGLHVGFLSRLWHQLQFSIRWSRPVAGHVWVHEGRVSPHGPENRPPGPQNPRPQPPSQCHFIWHRSALSFLSFYVCSISGTK